MDAAQLDRLLGAWLGEADAPLEHIAIDGKALRGTSGLHLFSAFAIARESVVAQLAIPAKTATYSSMLVWRMPSINCWTIVSMIAPKINTNFYIA